MLRVEFERLGIALLVTLFLAGCAGFGEKASTGFGLLGSGDTGPKPAALVEVKQTAAARIIWQANVGSSVAAVLTPAVDKGSVYAASFAGQLVRFDASTGRQVWRIDTGQKVTGGVGAGAGLVLVGTAKGEVLAFDSGGKSLWKATVSSEVLTPPLADEGIVVVRAGDGRIFGLDAADGKRKWVYQRSLPVLTVRSFAGMAMSRGAVFAGYAGGKLVAMNLSNGTVGWEATVSQPRGTTELERITDITSLPLLEERQACAVAYQGRVACFDITSGSPVWARELSSSAGLASDRRNIYVSDDKGAVVALDKGTGTSVWRQDKLFARRLSAPHVQGSYVVVGDYQGYLHFLNRDDGGFAARIATDGSAIVAPPVGFGEGFVVQTANGGLYALTVQ